MNKTATTITTATAALAIGAGINLATTTTASADVWDRVAQCESGGNWGTSTGNGFSGGLQFTPKTWAGHGGTGNPESAGKVEQKRVARNVLKSQGPGAWPVCSGRAGLNRSNGGSSQSHTPKPKAHKPKQHKVTQQPVKRHHSHRNPVVQHHTPAQQQHGGSVTVHAGDTLGSIAKRQGTTWHKLYQANSGKIANPNLIYVGQTLAVA